MPLAIPNTTRHSQLVHTVSLTCPAWSYPARLLWVLTRGRVVFFFLLWLSYKLDTRALRSQSVWTAGSSSSTAQQLLTKRLCQYPSFQCPYRPKLCAFCARHIVYARAVRVLSTCVRLKKVREQPLLSCSIAQLLGLQHITVAWGFQFQRNRIHTFIHTSRNTKCFFYASLRLQLDIQLQLYAFSCWGWWYGWWWDCRHVAHCRHRFVASTSKLNNWMKAAGGRKEPLKISIQMHSVPTHVSPRRLSFFSLSKHLYGPCLHSCP